ncbi:MAG TPA: DUF4258 domain-containing protein [Acetobacteraceae bacterium]|nr:DUF4258 domain-containing protein [Acetobacteraceae bacterium]
MIRLTVHVQRRIVERRIALAWIESAVSAPDWTSPDPDPALSRSFKTIPDAGGRVLRVVHRPDGPDILIVTAHFDRGARRT